MPLQVVSVSPSPDSRGQALEIPIQAVFNAPIDATTVTPATFIVTRQNPVSLPEAISATTLDLTSVVPGTLQVNNSADSGTIVFTSQRPLPADTWITVILSTRIKGTDGTKLDKIYRWSFATGTEDVAQPPITPSAPLSMPDGMVRQVPVTGTSIWLELVDATPPSGSSNLPLTTDTITLIFNRELAQDSYGEPLLPNYTLRAEPVDGNYWRNPAAGNLVHSVELSGTSLIFTLDLRATPLAINNLVSLIIPATLQAKDGSRLQNPIVYTFSTIYQPLYGSVRLVRSLVGSFIADIDNDAINLALYKASIDADYLIPPAANNLDADGQQYLEYLRQEYATVSAAIVVAINSERMAYRRKSKTVGDIQVSWEQSRIIEELLQTLRQQQQQLREELQTIGIKPLTPLTTIRSGLDPDMPLVGRNFSDDEIYPPAANARMIPAGSRRVMSGFINRPWRPRRW